MAGYLCPIGIILQYFTDQGVVLAGGKVNTYLPASTTPVTTYQDSTLGPTNANPITLLSNGRLPASCWVPAGTNVKMVLTDSGGNPITGGTIDNLPPINDPSAIAAYGPVVYGGTSTNSGNNYSLTAVFPFAAYANGVALLWVPNATNTGASTLNVNSLGAKTIVGSDGNALVAGALVLGVPALVLYQGGNFVLMIPANLRDIPQNIQNANYTTVLADDGKHLYHSDGVAYTWTIASNASVAYPIGATITGVNDSSGAFNITLAINTDTLVWVPSGATGSRTIAQFGRFTSLKVAATRWWVSGVGIT